VRKTYIIIVLVATLVVYASVLVSPGQLWIVGFLSMLIPFFLVFHLLGALWTINKLNRVFFYHLITLIIGLPFILVTFRIHVNQEGTEKFSVLSYNVRVFNNYAHLRNENFESSKKMVEWSVSDDSEIKCFQEFYNKNDSDIFNVVEKMRAAGWKHVYFKKLFIDRSKAEFGAVIFSKYPIVNQGAIYDDEGKYQKAIFADIRYMEDTIRIYSIHLKSMSIDVENVIDAEKLSRSYKQTVHRLRNGFVYRSGEVNLLARHISESPYPVILSGDLNDMPYSYSYFKLRNILSNAFEKAGNGFGFTYNGKLFFLRIDNQFFSTSFQIHGFATHREIKYSDHFPIKGVYSID